MEGPTPELPAVRLPRDQHTRPVRPGCPVRKLLALWGEGEEGRRESGGWRSAGYHPGRLTIYLVA